MKKRFLLLLCSAACAPQVFASAEDVLTLSGAALNAAQTIAADDSLIITETITDEEGTSGHRAVPPLKRPSSGGLYPAG